LPSDDVHDVNKVLEGDAEMTGRYAALALISAMKELALLLNAAAPRMARSLHLSSRSSNRDQQRMTNICAAAQHRASPDDEFMLAANGPSRLSPQARYRISAPRDEKRPVKSGIRRACARVWLFIGVEILHQQKSPCATGAPRARKSRPGADT